jgi:exonuclease III
MSNSLSQRASVASSLAPKNLCEKLKIGFWNARSLKNKTSLVTDYMMEHDIDIYLLAESWLKDEDEFEIGELQGNLYRYIAVPRVDRPGGGVACLFKKHLKVTKSAISKKNTFEYMEVVLDHMGKKTTFVTVYRPEPSGRNRYIMSDFFDEFTRFLAHYHSIKGDVIIVGDFNFHINKRSSVLAKKFLNILKMFELKQHISSPTHESGNTLDLLITHADTSLKHTVDEQNSDHNNILFELSIHKPIAAKKIISFRKTKDIDIDKFKIDLKNRFEMLNDSQVNTPKTPNDLHTLMMAYESSKAIFDNHAPETKRLITIRNPTPWNTSDIRPAKIAKRKAEKKWRRTKQTIDYHAYKEAKNSYNKLLNDMRTKEIAKRIKDNNKNSKNMFKALNSILHRKQELPLPPHGDEKTLANSFCKFFEEKVSKIRQRVDSNNSIDDHSEPLTYIGKPLTGFKLLSETEVKQILLKMNNKHCEMDPLPFWLLKECIDEFLPIITQIINASLQTGTMPQSLKHAHIIPTLKKNNLELIMKNYRPVSNLQYLGKAIESTVISQYLDHLTENKLHDAKQSAYKKFHSTETLLIKIHNDIMSSLGRNEVVLLTLLDLSAAFDTIDHNILLNRLEKREGVEGTALEWIRSYLSGRTQSVKVNNTESDSVPLKYGVPQGSKLGPVLFNSYIAPVSEIAKNNNIEDEKYADDHQLILAFRPKHQQDQWAALSQMEKCIKEIRNFLQDNKLCNNSEKTEFLLIGTPSQLKQIQIDNISIDNTKITTVDKARNLGVIFDKFMTMENQVNKACRNTYFNIRNISKIRRYLTKEDSKTVVNALVTPHLDYGNGLLMGIKKNLLNKMQIAQNSAVRLIQKVPRHEHITKYRKQLHWLPIQARIEFKILSMTWKALNKQAPGYLSNLLSLNTASMNLRSKSRMMLEIPEAYGTNNFADRAFNRSAPHLWNKLPDKVRKAETISSFKKSLKTHLFNKYYP